VLHVAYVQTNPSYLEKEDETLTFIGTSEICDPGGTIREQAGRTGREIGLVTIDPREARDRRINAYNDVLDDRRPDTYRFRKAADSAAENPAQRPATTS
jgi:predicted amidohydrolase